MRLPRSWREVTISTFLKVHHVLMSDLENIDKHIHTLSILSGKTVAEIEALPIDNLIALMKDIDFLTSLDNINTKVPRVVVFDGKVFDVVVEAEKLTGAQYIDITSMMKDKEATLQNIHNLLAVICIPRRFFLFKGKYDGETHKARADFFYSRFPMDMAYAITLFFCKVSEYSMAPIKTYLEQEAKRMNRETASMLEKATPNDGDGSSPSITSRRATYQNGSTSTI